MVNLFELRAQLERKMQDLIDGTVGPEEASRWAYDLYQDVESRAAIEASPSLSDLFDSLSMSNLRHSENGPFMYDINTYKEWCNEYIEEYAEEINKENKGVNP